MSYLVRRKNTILVKSGSNMIPGVGYYVTAYPVGAQITSNDGGGNFTIRAGHGLINTAKTIVMSGDTMIDSSLRTVSGVPGATSVTLSSDVGTAAPGDYIVNLGVADAGGPTYDGSPLSIYDTMDTGGTPKTRAENIAGADGEYSYWHGYSEVWELVRNTTGTPVKLWQVPGGNVVGPAATVLDNEIVRFDSTTGQHIQGYTSDGPTISDTGAVNIPLTLGVTGAVTLGAALSVGTTLAVAGNTALAGSLKLPSASVSVGAGTTNITTAGRGLIQITSTGASTITLSAPSSIDGQLLILYVVSVATSLSLADSTTVNLSATWSPNANDTLTLVAVGTVWYELARSAN